MNRTAVPSLLSPVADVPESFWVSLLYFNYYRISVAVMLLLTVLFFGDALTLGSYDLSKFTYTSIVYLAVSFAFLAALIKWRTHFSLHLTFQVLCDVAALVMLMWSSGGMRSGLGVMVLISLAAAALVSRGALMLFYAAIASLAVLLEQSYWILVHDLGTANFLQPGLLSIGYFATALVTNRLAQRVIMNERVARQRGSDLANHLRINQLVIRDVQDGVLVVDSNGLVRQHNRQVTALLGKEPPELGQIQEYSEELALRLAGSRSGGPTACSLTLAESGKLVRARFVAAGVAGDSFTLVFLEDQSRLQEQAQQLKLAALGRLTANIAHEIRNPLSAITHAGDLLKEESRGAGRIRLVEIIQDNAARLDRMVGDVLELSRRDRVQPELLALKEFLGSFVGEFSQNEAIQADAIRVEAVGNVVIEFDRVHLNQVLWNLARNAWRHSRKMTGSVRFAAQQRGKWVELHVLDDGNGVTRELQAQLFEPFFTTFSNGTGLGLYIARELCAANSTKLDYIDRPNGADFRISWQSPQ